MTRHRRMSALVAGLVLAACGKEEEPVVAAVEVPAEPRASLAGGLTPTTTEPVLTPGLTSFSEAEAAYRDGRIGEARDYFLGYVAIKPDNPWGHYMLGLTLWRRGDFAAAEPSFRRSIELDDQNPKAYFNVGRVLLGLDRPHEAFEQIELGLALDSTSADGIRLLARAHAKLDNIDGALETYRRALVRDENDVWSLNNLGMLYLETGNPEAALGPLARAVTIRATSPIFQTNLGVALERTGHPGSAKRAFEAAVRADSTYHKARKNFDRLSQLVTDSTPPDRIVVADLAETFRLQVGMWKDGYPRPAVDTVPPASR